MDQFMWDYKRNCWNLNLNCNNFMRRVNNFKNKGRNYTTNIKIKLISHQTNIDNFFIQLIYHSITFIFIFLLIILTIQCLYRYGYNYSINFYLNFCLNLLEIVILYFELDCVCKMVYSILICNIFWDLLHF